MNEVKEYYEEINRRLIEELPKLIDLRVPNLDPSFEALIKTEIQFASEAAQSMQQLKQYFAQKGQNNPFGGSEEGRVDQVLQKLRDLQIVSMASSTSTGSLNN